MTLHDLHHNDFDPPTKKADLIFGCSTLFTIRILKKPLSTNKMAIQVWGKSIHFLKEAFSLKETLSIHFGNENDFDSDL